MAVAEQRQLTPNVLSYLWFERLSRPEEVGSNPVEQIQAREYLGLHRPIATLRPSGRNFDTDGGAPADRYATTGVHPSKSADPKRRAVRHAGIFGAPLPNWLTKLSRASARAMRLKFAG